MSELPQPTSDSTLPEAAMTCIVDALRGLRFGSVVVTVQDGVVVQIDRNEKRRLTVPCASSTSTRSC